MTINPPEYDPDANYHNAIVFDESNDDRCHAVISSYDGPEQTYKTECGIHVAEWSATEPRYSFDEPGVTMCPDCWPEHIVSDTRGDETDGE